MAGPPAMTGTQAPTAATQAATAGTQAATAGTQAATAGTQAPTASQAATTGTVVDRFLHAIERATIPACQVWGEDAVLDATVPNWRMQLAGPEAIRREYARWFADPGHFHELRRYPIDGGEVVDYTLSWQENGVPHAAHHMHLLKVRDDLIVADTVLCGGRWPASLLAEMEAADA